MEETVDLERACIRNEGKERDRQDFQNKQWNRNRQKEERKDDFIKLSRKGFFFNNVSRELIEGH